MKHIVIVVAQICLGGAERVAALWAKGFVDRGYKVTILTDTSKPVDYVLPKDVNLCHFVFSKNNLKRNIISSILGLRKLFQSLSPDLIISVLYPMNFLCLFSTLGLHIPIVNTEHNAFERPKERKLSLIAYFSKFYLNKFFSHVTLLTSADKKFIGKRLSNVSVLPNPLTFTPLKTITKKEKWIIASGRLDDWYYKGFDVLIKVWAKLSPKYPEWKLKICGAGSEKSLLFLQSLASSMNVKDRIEFLGFRKDIESLYAKSSVFVLSSRYEGFGMVLIEAMSQACACVACDFKGRQHEIIENDKQGLLCEPDNIDSLESSLKKMLEDEFYRITCQSNAVKRSKFFELNNVMNYWNDILKRLGV